MPLPPGALAVRSPDGQPLIAEMRAIGRDDGIDSAAALADVLSIAGDFADIPGSRSFSPLYRTLTREAKRSGTRITATIFFLRERTPLEVSVNKTFSLNIPEKPLELDLAAIAPNQEFGHCTIMG